MIDFYEKNKHTLNKLITVVVLILGIYLFFRYVFSYVAPFIIAWLIASSMEPLVRWLQKKCKLPRGISTVLSIIIILIFLVIIVTGIVMRIVQQAQAFAQDFPIYYQGFMYSLENIRGKTETIIFELPEYIQYLIRSGFDGIIQSIPNMVGPGVRKGSIGFVVAVPNALFISVVTLIATFFISKDKIKIQSFIERQLPSSWTRKIDIIRRDLFGALLGYIKTQLILMIFVSSICIIGLTILRAEYSLLIGFIIGVFDAFPVLGSGGILIPWAIYNFITGNVFKGAGLLIIYGLVIVFRQMFEPKVLGTQIGVYPLVTLIAMYVGIKLFGVIGIVVGPIVVIFVKTMQKVGIIPEWK